MALTWTYRRMRWVITALLTLSTILNLLDRQTLSILAPFLRDHFQMSVQAYANIVTAFQISYTIMYAAGGRLVDRVGERAGMAACILWWSVCTMLTAFVQGAVSLGAVRFLLGLGEPGNYPAALRATTRWFPKSERGLPIACFSSGSAVGNLLAPPLVAGLSLVFGWRAAFLLPGALGLVWLAIWLAVYRMPAEYPGMSIGQAQELAAEASPASGRWFTVLRNRNVLALLAARLITDPVWYFYIFWIPEYLKRERGFSLNDIGMFGWIPFVAGAIGGMVGGRASDLLIARRMRASAARRRVLYISTAIAPLGVLTSQVRSAAAAIALIAVAAFVVYSWFINTAAIIPDLVPENETGTVLGFIGTAGSATGALFTQLVGYLVAHHSYGIVFVLAGSMHVVGALILWIFMRDEEATVTA